MRRGRRYGNDLEGDLHSGLKMAIVTTTIVPVLTLFPWADKFAGMPKSIQPIGELMANSRDAAITLSGAGDTQEARWSITLPANYAYVLTNYSSTIAVGATNTWPDLQSLIFSDTIGSLGGTQTFEWGVGLKSDGVTIRPGSVTEIQVYRPTGPLPSFLQFGGGIWNSTFIDLTAEEPVAELNATARFLVYTVDQQYDANVNTPQLIR